MKYGGGHDTLARMMTTNGQQSGNLDWAKRVEAGRNKDGETT